MEEGGSTASAFIEREADEESDSEKVTKESQVSQEQEEEEEEDKGLDEFEKDDFLVDEEEEEEEAPNLDAYRSAERSANGVLNEDNDDEDADGEAAEKKKDSGEEEEAEEDEELELAEEDLEIAGKTKKRKRRLKKLHSKENAAGTSGINDNDAEGNKALTAEELQRKLFGRVDLEDEDADDFDKGKRAKAGESSDSDTDDLSGDVSFDSESDEDEFRDFIDDTEINEKRVVTEDMDDEQRRQALEMEQRRQKRKKQKQKRKQRARAKNLLVSTSALREAQQLFGDVDGMLRDYEEQKQQRLAASRLESTGNDNELAHSVDDSVKNLQHKIEPGIMEQHYFTDEDDAIRALDVPERLQLHKFHTFKMDENDFIKERDWICDQLLGLGGLSQAQKTVDILEHGIREVDNPSTEKESSRKMGRRFLTPKRENVYEWRNDDASQTELKEAIMNVLKDLHSGYLDIPFIAMYRKNKCGELLNLREEDQPKTTTKAESYQAFERKINVPPGSIQAHHRQIRRWDLLWKVYDLAVKWIKICDRSRKRLEAYRRLQNRASELGDEAAVRAVQTSIDLLEYSVTPQTIEDADAKFRLWESVFEDQTQNIGGHRRRLKKYSQYSNWKKLVPVELIEAMSITPEQLAENILMQFKKYEPSTQDESPEKFVERVRATDSGIDYILTIAKNMIALQLSSEPRIKEFARTVYKRGAEVSTKPAKSHKEIRDPMHIFGPVSRLVNKPIHTFKEGEWLYITAAEEDGVLEVSFQLTEQILNDDLMSIFESAMLSSGSGNKWNYHRKLIIREAIFKHLLPQLEKETRAMLLSEAKEWARQQVFDSLWKTLSVQPWQPDVSYEYEEKYIMSCVWGPDRHNPTTLVMLKGDGNFEMTDYFESTWFSGNLDFVDKNSDSYRNGSEALRLFITMHKPQICVLSTSSAECVALKDILENIISDIVEKHAQDMMGGNEQGDIQIIYATQAIPHLYATSNSADAEFQASFGDITPNVREAVALARTFFDPLPIVSSLFSKKREILSLNLHEVQEFLSKDEHFETLERCIVTVMNQVGLDINDVLEHSWKRHSLQFLSGLGPRKAPALLRAIQFKLGSIESRQQLAEVMGDNIWKNSSAMLEIKLHNTSHDLEEILDSTRIHPNSYSLVKEVSAEMCKTIENKRKLPDVEIVMNSTDNVEKFAFNDFAINTGNEGVLSELLDIGFELLLPFKDVRKKWSIGNEFDVVVDGFKALIKPGSICQASRLLTTDHPLGAIMKLDNGLHALLPFHDISDDPKAYGTSEYKIIDKLTPKKKLISVRVMQLPAEDITLDVRTTRFTPQGDKIPFKKEIFNIRVSCKGKDLENDSRWEEFYCKIPNYEFIDVEKEEEKLPVQKIAKIQKRPISDPYYHNYDIAQTEKYLKGQEDGTFIFRPSSKGIGTLSMTLKISSEPFILMHEEINETQEVKTLALGKELRVKSMVGEVYEDLDEVRARFGQPLWDTMRDATEFPKFMKGTLDQIESYLKKSVKKTKYSAIALSFAEECPGYLRLSYLMVNSSSGRIRKEYIKVLPGKYVFRKESYRSLKELYNSFKTNYSKKRVEQDPNHGNHHAGSDYRGHYNNYYDSQSQYDSNQMNEFQRQQNHHDRYDNYSYNQNQQSRMQWEGNYQQGGHY